MGLGFSFLFWIKFIIGVEMSKSWYVLNSYSGYENKAKEQLLERITLNGMEDFFGKIEVPSEEITEMKGGKEKTVQKKFFPGYILIKMKLDKVSRYFIENIQGVISFVGARGKQPTPLTDSEIKKIFGEVERKEGREMIVSPFQKDDSVKIIAGPFIDFSGIVMETNDEKQKVIVTISIFGRSTPVELDYFQVELER